MTQALPTPDLTAPPPAADPYRYGYREVRRRQPDGSYELLRLPLTLWDLLHPQEDDKPMQGLRHTKECNYLYSVLDGRYAHDRSVLVLQDVAVYWDIPGVPHHSPDVTVIFHIDRPRDEWPSFHVAQEGVRPVLIIEVVSPKVRDNDVVTKFREYHRAELPLYVIVDRKTESDWPTLLGFHYTPDGYEPLNPDAEGCLLLEPVGLKIGTRQNRVVLYDAETGAEQGDYAAICEALEAEMAAREAAEERAVEAEKKARIEADARTEAEKKARTEAEARTALEERLRLLEAEMQRLKTPPASPGGGDVN